MSFVWGAAAVVVIVGALAFLSLRPESQTDSELDGAGETAEETIDSGQFFQQIPNDEADSSPEASPSPSVSPPAGAATSGAVTITISETGFSPAAVTVTAGTTVTFVNNGQAAHWPASDVHPTHNILPDFDAKRGLGTGETYSYTFDQAGTWRCHDHLMAQETCTITVTQ